MDVVESRSQLVPVGRGETQNVEQHSDEEEQQSEPVATRSSGEHHRHASGLDGGCTNCMYRTNNDAKCAIVIRCATTGFLRYYDRVLIHVAFVIRIEGDTKKAQTYNGGIAVEKSAVAAVVLRFLLLRVCFYLILLSNTLVVLLAT